MLLLYNNIFKLYLSKISCDALPIDVHVLDKVLRLTTGWPSRRNVRRSKRTAANKSKTHKSRDMVEQRYH